MRLDEEPADPLEHCDDNRAASAPDLVAAADAVNRLLRAMGVDSSEQHVQGTPRRVALALAELLHPQPFEATVLANEEAYDEMVLVRDISFVSLCSHHLLPFKGVAHVAYIPGRSIVGLSKLARAVDFYSRHLQVQERLTQQIADWMDSTLEPRGCGVILKASHLCMSMRGAKADGNSTVTSALRGLFRTDARTRAEFLSLSGGSTVSWTAGPPSA